MARFNQFQMCSDASVTIQQISDLFLQYTILLPPLHCPHLCFWLSSSSYVAIATSHPNSHIIMAHFMYWPQGTNSSKFRSAIVRRPFLLKVKKIVHVDESADIQVLQPPWTGHPPHPSPQPAVLPTQEQISSVFRGSTCFKRIISTSAMILDWNNNLPYSLIKIKSVLGAELWGGASNTQKSGHKLLDFIIMLN